MEIHWMPVHRSFSSHYCTLLSSHQTSQPPQKLTSFLYKYQLISRPTPHHLDRVVSVANQLVWRWGLCMQPSHLYWSSSPPLVSKSPWQLGQVNTNTFNWSPPSHSNLICNAFNLFVSWVGFSILRLQVQGEVLQGQSARPVHQGLWVVLRGLPVCAVGDVR